MRCSDTPEAAAKLSEALITVVQPRPEPRVEGILGMPVKPRRNEEHRRTHLRRNTAYHLTHADHARVRGTRHQRDIERRATRSHVLQLIQLLVHAPLLVNIDHDHVRVLIKHGSGAIAIVEIEIND